MRACCGRDASAPAQSSVTLPPWGRASLRSRARAKRWCSRRCSTLSSRRRSNCRIDGVRQVVVLTSRPPREIVDVDLGDCSVDGRHEPARKFGRWACCLTRARNVSGCQPIQMSRSRICITGLLSAPMPTIGMESAPHDHERGTSWSVPGRSCTGLSTCGGSTARRPSGGAP